jgi:hypothetical protein
MKLVIRQNVCCLFLVLLPSGIFAQKATAAPEWGETISGLRMSAQLGAYPAHLKVHIENISHETIVLRIGAIIGGRKIPELNVLLSRGDRKYRVINSRSLIFVGGTISPLLVTLPAGTAYALNVSLNDYIVNLTGANDQKLGDFLQPGDELRVQVDPLHVRDEAYLRWAPKRAPSAPYPWWQGVLVSNTLRIPVGENSSQ